MARKRNRSIPKKVITDVDDRRQEEVQLQLDVDHSKYDACNQLVITRDKKGQIKTTKPPTIQRNELSKKKKKKLQKILDRKDRIKDRKAIIEELKKYSVSSEHYSKLASVCKSDKKRSKRESVDDFSKSGAGSSQKRARIVANVEQTCSSSSLTKDLNIVGFEDSSEDDKEELDEAIDQQQKCTDVENVDKSELLSTKSNEKSLKSEVSTCNDTKESCDIEKTEFVSVPRLPEVEKSRLQLPMLAEEQIIMETIRYNPIVVICGETGSGKTTQVPQFLFEAGYARTSKICVTEPRRVAAISMSKRVAYEMNFSNNIVSYQIRFDGNINPETKICFVTDGILMREIQKDFLLSSFSVIVIDEAHERSLYSDILIGLLSRIVPLRYKKGSPLRLIIMSATLRVEDFTSNSNLFKVEPKILRVQSRQFSVTIHFSKKTPEDYVQEAYAKVCSIHRTFGDGGILVFVTGQQEVYQLCSKLRKTFAVKSCTSSAGNNLKADNCQEVLKKKSLKHKQKILNDLMPSINLDDYTPLSDEEDDIFNDEIEKKTEEQEVFDSTCKPIYCRPLFAKLAEDKQSEIFTPPPEGSRLCVVATNIAETSLTIPGIKYVVDTGKVKVKVFDKLTGVSTMIVTWTSKASADQRAGRAGRTSNGHCFRLYSSAVYKEQFPQFSTPEIVSKPVDELFLQMKAMNIDNVVNFPFPTPPSNESLLAAEKRLLLLGALKVSGSTKVPKEKSISRVTDIGKAMSFFPLNPRYSKMIVLSANQGLLCYAVALVSALTVQEIFLNLPKESEKFDKRKSLRHKWNESGNSLLLGDFMLLLKAVGCSTFVKFSEKMIEAYGLRYKAMIEIKKLRQQLTHTVTKIFATKDIPSSLEMDPPTDSQCKLLRQIVLSALLDHVAKKVDTGDLTNNHRQACYKSMETEKLLHLSHDSVLKDVIPEFVVYQEIYESSEKLFMRNVVAIEKEWLPIYAADLCTFSKPLESPTPRFDSASDKLLCHVTATYGPFMWSIPATEVEFPEGVEKYRWFAKCFLEGTVFSVLLEYKSSLLSSPSVMVKSWAKLQPRTESLLSALYSKKCASRKRFVEILRDDESYLLEEYCEWIPPNFTDRVRNSWKKMFS